MKKMSTILETTTAKPVTELSRFYQNTGNGMRVCALTAIALAVDPKIQLAGHSIIENRDSTVDEFVAKRYNITNREAFAISDAFIHANGNFKVAAEIARWIENGVAPIEEIEQIVKQINSS